MHRILYHYHLTEISSFTTRIRYVIGYGNKVLQVTFLTNQREIQPEMCILHTHT